MPHASISIALIYLVFFLSRQIVVLPVKENASGTSKQRCAMVKYTNPNDAMVAVEQLNGKPMAEGQVCQRRLCSVFWPHL